MNLTAAELRLPRLYAEDDYPSTVTLLHAAKAVRAHLGIADQVGPCGSVMESYAGKPFDVVRDAETEVGHYLEGKYVVLVKASGKTRAESNRAAMLALARMIDPSFEYGRDIEEQCEWFAARGR